MTRAQKRRLERLEAQRPPALPVEDPEEIARKAAEYYGQPYRPPAANLNEAIRRFCREHNIPLFPEDDTSKREPATGVGTRTD